MKYDVAIIGAGLSGLTAGALLAKRKLKVCVIDAQYKPGGSCGIFKRNDVVFEQGAAMIYGFGESGFNPHRFAFNILEEPIDIIKHDELYAINFDGHRIIFYEDMDMFIEELVKVFPKEKNNFKRFYSDLSKMYKKVIADDPTFITPDVLKKEKGLQQLLSHPISYIKFLGFMNTNTEKLLKKYFKDPKVLNLFDKLTSTYCYTNVKETPAILSAVMFVDNHFGGSYYPAGSTLNLVGKLEKVIEENNGDMIYNRKVEKIIVGNNKVTGVLLDNEEVIYSDRVINSGNVWNLYNKLIKENASKESIDWANSLVPTYPSLVLFSLVKEEAIPPGTLPIEMLVDDKTKINEGELTAYILSIDDKTLCKEGYHTVVTIGPSFKEWPRGFNHDYNNEEYRKAKEIEQERILNVLENRFPGFKSNLVHVELSTPSSLERYILKEKGAVAGPKQQLGQHMMKRLKTKGEIEGLYNCGESTVMGTGTPTVTISGISAANLILRELGIEEYEYKEDMKDYVNIVKHPFNTSDIKISDNIEEDKIAKLAMMCQYCENPICEKSCELNVCIRDINRKVSVGNFYGAKKLLSHYKDNICEICEEKNCKKVCIRNKFDEAVQIDKINSYIKLQNNN